MFVWRYHVRNRNNICASPDPEAASMLLLRPDSLPKRSLFLDRAKSVLCKKLHGQNCSFSSRVALLVALRERWAVWSVVRLSVTPQSFLSPGHTTLVQPPITRDQAPPGLLRGNKANLVSDRFRNVIQASLSLMIGTVADFPDSAVSHGSVSRRPAHQNLQLYLAFTILSGN